MVLVLMVDFLSDVLLSSVMVDFISFPSDLCFVVSDECVRLILFLMAGIDDVTVTTLLAALLCFLSSLRGISSFLRSSPFLSPSSSVVPAVTGMYLFHLHLHLHTYSFLHT